jgi:hypothetical protein
MFATTAKIAIESDDGTWTDVTELTGAIDWPELVAIKKFTQTNFEVDPVRNRELLDKLYGWGVGQMVKLTDHATKTVYEGKLTAIEPATGRFVLEAEW